MSIKDLTMEYMTACLIHEMSKGKEKEPQCENAAIVSKQSKACDPSSQQSIRTYFYCSKPSHIAQFCYKTKNKKRENVQNAKDKHEITIATQHGVHYKSVCKWIMDS